MSSSCDTSAYVNPCTDHGDYLVAIQARVVESDFGELGFDSAAGQGYRIGRDHQAHGCHRRACPASGRR